MYDIDKVYEETGMQADVFCTTTVDEPARVAVTAPVSRTGKPLSVELGPGLMETVYDDTQRSLKSIADKTSSVYIPRGIALPALHREKKWEFTPTMKEGDYVSGRDIWGKLVENSLLNEHRILMPPRARGIIRRLQTQLQNRCSRLSLMEKRKRVFDCGKTVISPSVSKISNSDVIVYIGCSEPGNEMAEVLMGIPKLSITIDGRKKPIIKRTCLKANTSNMPDAAREASVYTGITLVEYSRDPGKAVTMIIDSISRWAETLRGISGRLGEMPADQGFPAYLGSKLASFDERAGAYSMLGSPQRQGSVSIIGAVSLLAGDYLEPVTASTLSIVQVFWVSTRGLPSVSLSRRLIPPLPIVSTRQFLTSSIKNNYPTFPRLRDCTKELLPYLEDLEQIVQLVGKNASGNIDKIILDITAMLKDDFLQQNGDSDYDQFCLPWKTEYIIKALIGLYDEAQKAVSGRLSWVKIRENTSDIQHGLRSMKFQLPDDEEGI